MMYLRHEAGMPSTMPTSCTAQPNGARSSGGSTAPTGRLQAGSLSLAGTSVTLPGVRPEAPDEDFAETFARLAHAPVQVAPPVPGWPAMGS